MRKNIRPSHLLIIFLIGLVASFMRANESLLLQASKNKTEKDILLKEVLYWKEYKGKLYLHEIRTSSIIKECRRCTRKTKNDTALQDFKAWIGEQN